MNKKNIAKITLDIAMAILFITFFNKTLISFKFHVQSGKVFGLLILVHMILNRKWIINITKRLFDSKIKIRTKLSYICSLILLISIIFIIFSGMMMMTAPNYDRKMFYKMLHFGASYLSVGLIGIHVGLYWKFVMNMFKKLLKINKSTSITKILANLCVVTVLVFGIYTTYKQEYFNKLPNTLTYAITHIIPQDLEEPEGGTYEKESLSFISLATTYGSIISVFGIATYYIDLALKERDKSKELKAEIIKELQRV